MKPAHVYLSMFAFLSTKLMLYDKYLLQKEKLLSSKTWHTFFFQLGSANVNSVIKTAYDIKILLTFCFFNQKSEDNSGNFFLTFWRKINPATDFYKWERKQIHFIQKIEEILAWYFFLTLYKKIDIHIHYIKVVI